MCDVTVVCICWCTLFLRLYLHVSIKEQINSITFEIKLHWNFLLLFRLLSLLLFRLLPKALHFTCKRCRNQPVSNVEYQTLSTLELFVVQVNMDEVSNLRSLSFLLFAGICVRTDNPSDNCNSESGTISMSLTVALNVRRQHFLAFSG